MDAGTGGDAVSGRPVTPASPAERPVRAVRELGGPAQALLEAFASISSDLDTGSVLLRIVESACRLTGAQAGGLAVLDHEGRVTDVVSHDMGDDAVRAIAALPGHHAEREGFLVVPVRVRGTLFGRLYVDAKHDGHPFTTHDELLVTSLSSVAGFVIENARAYGVSERRRRWLELFGELSERLTPPIAISDALQRVAEVLLEASGARCAAVVQVADDGRPFMAALAGEALPLDREEQARFDDAVRAVVQTGDVTDVHVRGEWVAVIAPLRAHLTMPGVVILYHPEVGSSVVLEERDLLTSFADQAALAVDRAQAVEDREQLAVISDRDRIARELHDVVIQRLFATGLHMQSIRAAASDELRERIDQSVRDLDQTIRDIRSTIFQLQNRPRNSLRTDVRETVRGLIPQLGFAPSVETQGPVDNAIDAKVQQQLVAVLHEALVNVAQHAQASRASVQLQVTPTHLRLKVSDDGRGIPEERNENGLRNARRRAMLLGGSLDLWPNEPTGTVFVWAVPYESGSEEPGAAPA